MLIQIILSFFLLFAISRVLIQVRSRKLTIGAFLFWSALFVFALVGVIEPNLTTHVAKYLGIGRGADVVIYVSIVLLFYLIFRLSISLEEARRDLAQFVRKVALNEYQKKLPRKTKARKT